MSPMGRGRLGAGPVSPSELRFIPANERANRLVRCGCFFLPGDKHDPSPPRCASIVGLCRVSRTQTSPGHLKRRQCGERPLTGRAREREGDEADFIDFCRVSPKKARGSVAVVMARRGARTKANGRTAHR